MTSKRRSLINLLSLSYLSISISKSLLIKVLISIGEILINFLAMKGSSTLTFIMCSTVDVPQAV